LNVQNRQVEKIKRAKKQNEKQQKRNTKIHKITNIKILPVSDSDLVGSREQHVEQYRIASSFIFIPRTTH
jgi:hypothetical protein